MIPGGPANPYSATVVLTPSTNAALVHFDGAHGTTTAPDAYGNPVIFSAGATITTATSRFGSGCIVATSTDLESGFRVNGVNPILPTQFTLEAWVSFPSTATTQARYLLCALTSATYGIILEKDFSAPNHRLTLYISTASNAFNVSTASNVTAPAPDTWHHFAIVRDTSAGNYYSYYNGTAVHTVSTTNTAIGIANVGAYGVNRKIMGYLDEFRYSDSCKYPGGITFTPSTSSFLA